MSKFSFLIGLVAILSLLNSPVFAINAKSHFTPALAFYEGKLHLIFAGHNNSHLWDAVYDPETRRWHSLGQIHDEDARRSWARSHHTPVAVNVVEPRNEWLQLLFLGHNNPSVWQTAKRDGANPAFDPWDTPSTIPGIHSDYPIGAAMQRWRRLVTPKLTVAYARSDKRVYYRILDRGWSEERSVPLGTVDDTGIGVTLLSSTRDDARSEYPSLYLFYANSGLDVAGRYVWYARTRNGREWDSPRSLPSEAPALAYSFSTPIGSTMVVGRPGPIAAVDHPLGIVVAYKSHRDSPSERGIWVGLSRDGSNWINLGVVQNIKRSLGNPAFAVKDAVLYMAFVPSSGQTAHLSPELQERVESEICVGVLNLAGSGGPQFQSIRDDLPASYCVRE